MSNFNWNYINKSVVLSIILLIILSSCSSDTKEYISYAEFEGLEIEFISQGNSFNGLFFSKVYLNNNTGAIIQVAITHSRTSPGSLFSPNVTNSSVVWEGKVYDGAVKVCELGDLRYYTIIVYDHNMTPINSTSISDLVEKPKF